MNDDQTKLYWEANADTWSHLSRAGADIYRDEINTPEFLKHLPDIDGLTGLDIGCGDGYNTRLLADKGAKMTGLDISEKFITNASLNNPHASIEYKTGTALHTSFPNGTFDFATGFMSFMDVSDIDQLFRELNRILKPGAFVQFSISHPCFNPLNRKNLKDENGKVYAVELSSYFDTDNVIIEEWLFDINTGAVQPGMQPFRIPRFIRTLSQWFNAMAGNGFTIEMMNEPRPTPASIKRKPKLINATVVAYFLHIRCRKSYNK
ncbi:class I SAM-dependent methyltransferase [Pseudobacter ginsenosidimutans]|uniref:Methyltransferase family protein n=1 Tax=Pseudobacter ginsenosidimutans TaxID=661488 RepID=A0A4Q7N4L3_9BACT|nr:class I SAM-dependent methyltransferase [Pseudobacter ginsenosidimutans]QEC44482.1 class I SAM-dependent methyltransferase [Pseudobacter ginsenosidimutans]RZS75954.1 methyltransferase family protein [Pseudobacter ginsenosidimutans]